MVNKDIFFYQGTRKRRGSGKRREKGKNKPPFTQKAPCAQQSTPRGTAGPALVSVGPLQILPLGCFLECANCPPTWEGCSNYAYVESAVTKSGSLQEMSLTGLQATTPELSSKYSSSRMKRRKETAYQAPQRHPLPTSIQLTPQRPCRAGTAILTFRGRNRGTQTLAVRPRTDN